VCVGVWVCVGGWVGECVCMLLGMPNKGAQLLS
jgi:hypothetical protein